jgi:hypothetical protein
MFCFLFFIFLFINAIKKTCEKHIRLKQPMLLKQHVLLTCQLTHVTLICGL